jgi:hypothetical protein
MILIGIEMMLDMSKNIENIGKVFACLEQSSIVNVIILLAYNTNRKATFLLLENNIIPSNNFLQSNLDEGCK